MGSNRKKISIIGSGNTGATLALILAQKELGDIVLVNKPESLNKATGKALDLLESTPIFGVDSNIIATADYQDTAHSDLVIITAGVARKPGMSRDDLVTINGKIMKNITKEIIKYSQNCIILVLTNPVDEMTYAVYKESGFSKNRVLGQSGVLDTARLATFIALELNVSVKDVTGLVLGGHGDDMVPLISYASVGGVPVEKLISKERLDQIIQRTRKGGGEIVNLLGDGSAYYAPSAALMQMAEAILKNQNRLLPAAAYLDGEYGYHDIYLGVPCILNANGVERIIELDLSDDEKRALEKSVKSVKDVVNLL